MLQEQRAEASDPITELLESRRVARNFLSPHGRIRVETRIRISRPPWTLRTAVLRDGVEFQRFPLAPIEEEEEGRGLRDLQHAREAFARRALERHEDFCQRVQEDLATEGGSILASRGVAPYLPSSRKRLLVSTAVGVALLLLGAGAVVVLLPEIKAPQPARASQPATPKEPAAVQASADPEGLPAATEPQMSAAEESILAAPQPEPVAERTLAPVTRPAAAKPPVARPAPRSRAVEPAPVEETMEPEPVLEEEEPSAPAGSLISDIEPARYKLGQLRTGQTVYVDTDASFASVPAGHEGLQCIRTAYEDRVKEAAVSFDLAQEARIYVGHDRRIRNKPGWLQSSFSSTGERVTFVGPVDGELIELELFAQKKPAGQIVLGPNTEWSSMTKILRSKIPKDLSMYIVCVGPK